ncbi:CTD small phosphatase-like protein 2 isoform X1 [Iris pallida]|uniref:CTD small phosphatase-like protein 2 isoform X1 n=1 Tax=Iris pallida TaxID=29817 RepID=A0AAX6GTH5_IRIPA|nr:CTD small phosphatase-like protein 2 isoform X1 [Iris pallida]KAJ6848916.1 CTD small phosphatase-like protein 2 isoform X1 [Iris pallida]
MPFTESGQPIQQKKVTVVAEKKVKELITSAKKQKHGGISSNRIREVEEARDLNTTFGFVQEEALGLNVAYTNVLDDERPDERSAQCVPDTIFSSAYHHAKDGCGAIPDKVDFMKFFKRNDLVDQHNHVAEQKANALPSHGSLDNKQNVIEKKMGVASTQACDMHADSTSRLSESKDTQENDACMLDVESNSANKSYDEYSVVGNLSSEVSAIYLAMQHSKLECLDEQSQDSISTEGYVEPDDSDEYDDFDPYVFIKDLPDLSAVVPKFRPVLLPKQTRSCPSTTLVLDLDETLVHSSLEPCPDADFTFPVNFNLKEHTIYVRCRPFLKDFMERVSGLFETIIFTASQSIYAERLLNILDPKRRIFRHRIYRESCVYVEGNYLKDLSVLGRDLSHVIIIDNSPQAFGFQLDNGIPIESWFEDRTDQALLTLLPFLESLVGIDDVRPMIAKRFNLREKVACSSCPSVDFRR